MIQTYAHQRELHEARLSLKTIEGMFVNLITEGTNCSFFESEVIVEKAKEVFDIGDHSEGNILQPGQMIWTALDINQDKIPFRTYALIYEMKQQPDQELR